MNLINSLLSGAALTLTMALAAPAGRSGSGFHQLRFPAAGLERTSPTGGKPRAVVSGRTGAARTIGAAGPSGAAENIAVADE